MSSQWRLLVPKLWGAFYANLRQPGWHKLGIVRRFSLLTRSVESIALRTLSAWGPTPFYVDSLNKLQRKMVSNLLRLFKCPPEDWKSFNRRKARAAARCIETHGKWWAAEWMRRCMKWNDHLQRDFKAQCVFLDLTQQHDRNANMIHTKVSWAPQLINFLDEQWFRDRRRICSFNLGRSISSRTDTRSSRGAVLSRWHDRVLYAKSQTM